MKNTYFGPRGVTSALVAGLLGCAPGGEPGPPVPVSESAPTTPPSTSPQTAGSGSGFYAPAQAARGAEAFRVVCVECHAVNEFRGRDFEWRWRRQTAWNLFVEISWTMPEDKPASLSQEMYADIVAYILEVNEYAAGDVELAATREALGAVPLGPNAPKTPQMEIGSP